MPSIDKTWHQVGRSLPAITSSLSIINLFLATAFLAGKTITLSPGDQRWFSVLSGPSLDPGDEIVLTAGTYSDRRRLEISQRGSLNKPIVIRAAEGAKVIFKRPDARQNTLNLAGCQHLVIRGLEITGGSAGIRMGRKDEHLAKFITLEGLHIHHIGGVAITANYPGETYESLVFRRNHIHHTGGHGEGFYLGSNNKPDGSTNGFIFNSIIELNYIHDLKGGTVSQGDGIELKDGSYGNIVRDNVIHDTNYPGVIVYDADGKAPNIIERNIIWNTGDHGIQAAADAVIQNNVIFNTGGEGISSRNHQSAIVGHLKISRNTILSERSIRITLPEKPSGPVVVAHNILTAKPRIPDHPLLTQNKNLTGIEVSFPAPNTDIGGGDMVEAVLANARKIRKDLGIERSPEAKEETRSTNGQK